MKLKNGVEYERVATHYNAYLDCSNRTYHASYAAHSKAFANAAIGQKNALQPIAHTVFQLQKKIYHRWYTLRRNWF